MVFVVCAGGCLGVSWLPESQNMKGEGKEEGKKETLTLARTEICYSICMCTTDYPTACVSKILAAFVDTKTLICLI